MPTFNDYLKLIQDHGANRADEIAHALRKDASLQEWHRKTLLVQLDMSLKASSVQSVPLESLSAKEGNEGLRLLASRR